MEETTKYLIVGGGLAAVWAAQNIRERDKEGRLIILSDEQRPPYDKPPLSKQYLAKEEIAEDDAYSKFDNFYPDNNIELALGKNAVGLNPGARTVTTEGGNTYRYEKLLLCTGAEPRSLEVPGSDLHNIFYLRTVDESLAIREAMKSAKRAVLVGAGYLNMEVASGCVTRGLQTTILERSDRPWSTFASAKLGKFMADAFSAKAARFLFGEEVSAFMGGGSVAAVSTKSGEHVEADMVVISVGAKLRTDLARAGGLQLSEEGAVLVDEYLQTSDPNVFAAGDIASFQDVALGKRWHAEHHLNAKWQGRVAGANMAGEHKPYDQVPYFFSDFLDLHMVMRGDLAAGKQEGTTVLGDMAGGEFVELYPGPDGALRMAVAISHKEPKLDPISDKLEEHIRAGTKVSEVTKEGLGMG